MHHSPKNRGYMLTTKNVHFVKLSKCETDFTIAFLSLRRSKNIYGMSNSKSDEEVMPSKRCLVVRSSDPSRDFRLSEVPTGVGTFGKPEEIFPGVWGYPYVRSSDKSQKFRLSGVPTQVGTSDWTSDIPDRKSCSDLAFWIPIRTVPNSWKTWKIRLGELFYWDKTTPLYIYERIMAD